MLTSLPLQQVRPLCLIVSLLASTLCGQQPAAGSETLLQHAITLHQAGDLEAAIGMYREYLAAEPDSVQARSNLGAALARTGRYDEAIAEYRSEERRVGKEGRSRR